MERAIFDGVVQYEVMDDSAKEIPSACAVAGTNKDAIVRLRNGSCAEEVLLSV